MAVVKLTLNEEDYQELRDLANQEGVTVQEFIRNRIFNRVNIFTPTEVVNRALSQIDVGGTFTIPELYTEEEYTIKRGHAGILGREFKNLIEESYSTKIVPDGYAHSGRHAQYKVISK